eukprot:3703978-Heterocapsa_arctica.AAC.1
MGDGALLPFSSSLALTSGTGPELIKICGALTVLVAGFPLPSVVLPPVPHGRGRPDWVVTR